MILYVILAFLAGLLTGRLWGWDDGKAYGKWVIYGLCEPEWQVELDRRSS